MNFIRILYVLASELNIVRSNKDSEINGLYNDPYKDQLCRLEKGLINTNESETTHLFYNIGDTIEVLYSTNTSSLPKLNSDFIWVPKVHVYKTNIFNENKVYIVYEVTNIINNGISFNSLVEV
jgi:hypothetical protein